MAQFMAPSSYGEALDRLTILELKRHFIKDKRRDDVEREYTDLKELELKVEVFVGGRNAENIYIDRPVMYDSDGKQILLTPQEARLRNLTYQTNLFADLIVDITKEDGNVITKEFPKTLIGRIPIMVHSDPCILHGQGIPVLRELEECIYDSGGYFIIDGKEKEMITSVHL